MQKIEEEAGVALYKSINEVKKSKEFSMLVLDAVSDFFSIAFTHAYGEGKFQIGVEGGIFIEDLISRSLKSFLEAGLRDRLVKYVRRSEQLAKLTTLWEFSRTRKLKASMDIKITPDIIISVMKNGCMTERVALEIKTEYSEQAKQKLTKAKEACLKSGIDYYGVCIFARQTYITEISKEDGQTGKKWIYLVGGPYSWDQARNTWVFRMVNDDLERLYIEILDKIYNWIKPLYDK
ncbi:hypothetical protein KEJ33_04635 [Candidatus Bathyarchaeota archaeon]|nr:hypothetical protein [Candidatus Bathyarchaeota archaeon]